MIFKCGLSLRSVQTKVKDPLPRRSSPRWCTKSPAAVARAIYIGETRRRLETRLKEHQECYWGDLEKSAVAEHAWKDHHTIKWEETTVVDMACLLREMLLKEATQASLTPTDGLHANFSDSR